MRTTAPPLWSGSTTPHVSPRPGWPGPGTKQRQPAMPAAPPPCPATPRRPARQPGLGRSFLVASCCSIRYSSAAGGQPAPAQQQRLPLCLGAGVVVFRDEHTARRAILGIGRPLPPEHQGGGANEASASTAGPPAAAAMDEPALMDVGECPVSAGVRLRQAPASRRAASPRLCCALGAGNGVRMGDRPGCCWQRPRARHLHDVLHAADRARAGQALHTLLLCCPPGRPSLGACCRRR